SSANQRSQSAFSDLYYLGTSRLITGASKKNSSLRGPPGRKSSSLSSSVPSEVGLRVYVIVRSGFPLASNTSRYGRSYVVIVASYDAPPLTIPKREPSPIGSSLRSSALLTREFHCVSLRRSASVSNTPSGAQAIRVVATARTRPILTRGADSNRRPLRTIEHRRGKRGHDRALVFRHGWCSGARFALVGGDGEVREQERRLPSGR